MPKISTKDLWAATAPGAQGEVHPADDAYAPPVTSVKLPSRGLIYDPSSPLYLCESLDIKGVTAKEENILASAALIRNGTVLTTLMKACLTNRLVDPDQMLIGDKNAVLIAIRVSAYGPKYPAAVTCPECKEESEVEFDVSRVNLHTLEAEPVDGPGNNRFTFELPTSKRRVTFRLMDVGMAAKLQRDTEAVLKKTGEDKAVTMRLLSQIVSIQGVEPKDLPRAIDSMAAYDSRSLRLHMDSIAPDVDMAQEFTCKSCGKASEVEIPLGPSFFWPSAV